MLELSSGLMNFPGAQMHVGPAGNKALAAAAEQAGIGAEEASDGVGALVQLLAETAKLNLNEQVRTPSLEIQDEKLVRKPSGEKDGRKCADMRKCGNELWPW